MIYIDNYTFYTVIYIIIYIIVESFSRSQDISTISSSHYSTWKATGHCSMVRFKEECLPHRIDCSLGRKSGWSKRSEIKPLRDTACCLCGKWLAMPCDWITWRSLKIASNRLQTTAQYASSWIWSTGRSFLHEWNARRTNNPVWLRNIKKRLL